MSNRISVSDELFTSIKRFMKQRGFDTANDAAESLITTGLSRKKALKQYADKKAAEGGKETKPRKPKGSKKKKAKKEKLEVAPEKKSKKKASANGEAKPKKKKKKEPTAPAGGEIVEEVAFN